MLREEAGVKTKREGERSCKVHPSARKSVSHKRERGKQVDSTLLDVKASTLQHVGQPYTVGRAGSTRNKETTKASIRKRFELADKRINFFISYHFFSHRINFLASLFAHLYSFYAANKVLNTVASREIVATISNLCVWYNLRQEKARDQERTVKSTCYRSGIFLFCRSEYIFMTNLEMPRIILKI